MGAWRGGYVDGIHVGVVDEQLRIVVVARYVVALGIAACFGAFTTHHGHDARARYEVERWPTLALGHLTATDEAPTYVCEYLHGEKRMYGNRSTRV